MCVVSAMQHLKDIEHSLDGQFYHKLHSLSPGKLECSNTTELSPIMEAARRALPSLPFLQRCDPVWRKALSSRSCRSHGSGRAGQRDIAANSGALEGFLVKMRCCLRVRLLTAHQMGRTGQGSQQKTEQRSGWIPTA